METNWTTTLRDLSGFFHLKVLHKRKKATFIQTIGDTIQIQLEWCTTCPGCTFYGRCVTLKSRQFISHVTWTYFPVSFMYNFCHPTWSWTLVRRYICSKVVFVFPKECDHLCDSYASKWTLITSKFRVKTVNTFRERPFFLVSFQLTHSLLSGRI